MTLCICEQGFSTMKFRKSCIRNRLTVEHLASLLRISTSRFEPDYEKFLEMRYSRIFKIIFCESLLNFNKSLWPAKIFFGPAPKNVRPSLLYTKIYFKGQKRACILLLQFMQVAFRSYFLQTITPHQILFRL